VSVRLDRYGVLVEVEVPTKRPIPMPLPLKNALPPTLELRILVRARSEDSAPFSYDLKFVYIFDLRNRLKATVAISSITSLYLSR
jgi:hypothetical protein